MFMTSGIVFDIQKFSIHDGPGIRTTVFLKGCTINCAWCHNPESKSFLPQLSYVEEKCVYCQACAKVCPYNVHEVSGNFHDINFDACHACGLCVDACPTGALSIYGKNMSVDQVIEEVKKDMLFYQNSNGGLTLSGGEPLAQPDFALALAKAARSHGINVAVESALVVSRQAVIDIVPYVEWFLIDYKMTDKYDYQRYIQGNPQIMLDNLKLLNDLNAKIILRCPIIPNINDNHEHFVQIANLAKLYNSIDHVEILPYHPMGKSKAKAIGELYVIEEKTPDDTVVDQWIMNIKNAGYENVIKG